MRRQNAFLLVAALLGSVLPARAIPFLTPKVVIEYDHSAQLVHRTYSWNTVQMAVPLYVDDVKASVDKELKARGWQLVATGGEETLFAIGDVRGDEQLVDFYSKQGNDFKLAWGTQGFGAGWKPGYGVTAINALYLPQNNLVIDIFDSNSHQLVFRGVVGDDLSNTPEKNRKKLGKVVKQLFKKFPPKK